MTTPSALLSVTRIVTFFAGVVYGKHKKENLEKYVAQENHKKLAQLKEIGLDQHSLKGATFHMPSINDPWATEEEIKMRERIPSYYLSPTDEYAYQIKKNRESLELIYQRKSLIARSIAKKRQPGYHSFEPEEVMDIEPKQDKHGDVKEKY